MICYTSQFLVISILYHKEKIISFNVSINNFTVNFNGYISVKLNPWFCDSTESTFTFIYYCYQEWLYAVRKEKCVFLFVSDVNTHHEKWLPW